jgi:hypothetical protein
MHRGWACLVAICACGRLGFGEHGNSIDAPAGDDAPIDAPADAMLGGIVVHVGASPSALAVGDFDGDGKIDLVVANRGSNNVSYVRNLGSRTFAAPVNFAVGMAPVAITVFDAN